MRRWIDFSCASHTGGGTSSPGPVHSSTEKMVSELGNILIVLFDVDELEKQP